MPTPDCPTPPPGFAERLAAMRDRAELRRRHDADPDRPGTAAHALRWGAPPGTRARGRVCPYCR